VSFFGNPVEIVMRLWKKIFSAYVASATLSAPFVISGFY